MKRHITRALWAALALIPLFSCRLPPYDEGLSLGIQTAREMVALGAENITVGPIWSWDLYNTDREVYFIPNKGTSLDAFKSGFIAEVDERSFELSYVEYVPPPSDYFNFYRGWGAGITNEDSKTLNFLAETIKGDLCLGFTRFNADNYTTNRYILLAGPPSGLVDWHVIDYNLRAFIHTDAFGDDSAKIPTILGSSIWPRPYGDNYDDQVFFCRFDGSGRYAEVRYSTDPGSGIISPTIIREDIEFTFPDDFENAFYYHDGDVNISFLSYYSNTQRKYKNYSWEGDPPLLKPLIHMDRRINAVLTTRQLLSFEDNRCYVYDEQGGEQFDFLLGGLHFCYEIDLDLYGTPVSYLVFTLPDRLGMWDAEDELYFKVYFLPTDLLEELK
jgi:hypothetical protein